MSAADIQPSTPVGISPDSMSIGDIKPTDWDLLSVRAGLFGTHRFMSAVDTIEPIALEHCGVAVAQSDGVLAGLLPYWVGVTDESARYDPIALLRDIDPSLSDRSWRSPTLLGTRVGYSNCTMLAQASDSERSSTLDGLVSLATNGSGVVGALYLDAQSASEMARVLPASQLVLAGADAVLDVPEGGLSSLIEALPTTRRSKVRREVRRFEAAGVEVVQTRLDNEAEGLAMLLAQRLRKYGGGDVSIDELAGILYEYGRAFGDDALVLAARLNGILVAYVSLYRYKSSMYARSWGSVDLDPALAVYFNLGFYEAVRLATSLGVRRIHYGSLSYAAKVSRGARLVPKWSVFSSMESETLVASELLSRYNSAMGAELRSIDSSVDLRLPAVPV